MQKLLNWLDKYVVEVGVGLLLAFIPLYPKLPLIDILQTWVYVRIEDFVVAAVVGAWLVQLIRRRLSPKAPLALPIIFYWLVGGTSLLFALIFLREQMIDFFPHLAVLHYLRRIEYLIVFFIAATSIKNLKTVRKYLLVVALTLLGVCLYGFGQKFLGFPAFLTMNEEFAKGLPLTLGPAARMSSTFAGHYDLAAYLVLMIALFGSLIFGLKKRVLKIATFLLVLLSFLLLLLTGSRISFAVYLVAISYVLFLQKKKWLIIPVILMSLLLMNLVSQVSGRFGKTFRVEDVVYDVRTGKPIAAVEEEVLEEELPLGTGFIGLPTVGSAPPEVTKQAIIRRSLRTATMSAEIATISGEFLIKRAIVYDISFTTRFQGTWPRAIKAFRRNRLLGSGYSSIGIGTDSSYLRALGETGILGLIAFLGLFFSFGLLIKQGLAKITSPFGRSILIGMAGGILGLLLNAVLIDVFEASKVAFALWLLLGITAGMVNYYLPKRRPLFKEAMEVIRLPIVPFVVLAAMAFLVLIPSLGNYFVADDFIWLRWAYKTRIPEIPQLFIDAQGFFYRPLAKAYFVLTKPFFGLRPGGYHLVDFFLHGSCVLAAYFLTLRLTKKKLVALLAGLLFLIHPVNAESVLWVSSTSALLAGFFYLWGFWAYVLWRDSRRRWRGLFYLASVLVFAFGLVSHELMITFPLVLILFDYVFRQFKRTGWLKRIAAYLPFWFLVAVYLWVRNVVAQAHGLSGDYNYNLRHLPFNFVGNLIGYLGELMASFHFLPLYDLARSTLRTNKPIAFGLLIIALVIVGGFLALKKRKQWQFSQVTIFAMGWLVIVLLPFLGFGNIAERHLYPAHFGFFILAGLLMNWLYQKLMKRKGRLGLWLAIAIITAIFGFYLLEMEKVKREWHQAGEAANTILLALGTNYIEFAPGHSLYFVNPPLRFNRAWVFPVGLKEGIWFIYRDESLPIEITTDLEKTLDLTEGDPFAHVFIYEDGELKEVSR